MNKASKQKVLFLKEQYVDGQEICELLYELKLGIITNEIIVIDEDFFNDFN